MLDAKDTQFRLSEEGVISFQVQESNPLPGDTIARLVKGESALQPVVEISDARGVDDAALKTRLDAWLKGHLKTVLEPLIALEDDNEFKQPASDVLTQVHGHMGIVPRGDLDETIALLDTDDRRDVRSKKVRLGPILVFIPALNKPAAVRLRGLLWRVFQGADVPVAEAIGIPNDGIVSMRVDETIVNKDFYQAIGYPVFGGRAIRIDMLDRVICTVYDGADKGKFQAKHEMAEWLGCGIDDLYAVLSAMGHKKIEVAPAENEASAEDVSEAAAEEVESPSSDAVEDTPEKQDVKPEEKQAEKPELAIFFLKKGKAFEKVGGKAGGKKPFKKPDAKKFGKPKGKRNKSTQRAPKVMSAEAKTNPEDSPFAILQQLKK